MEPATQIEPQQEPKEKTEFEKFQELGKHLFSLPKSAADEKPAPQPPQSQKEQTADDRR